MVRSHRDSQNGRVAADSRDRASLMEAMGLGDPKAGQKVRASVSPAGLLFLIIARRCRFAR